MAPSTRPTPVMVWIATGLLGVCAVVYGVARWQSEAHPAWAYVRAFAEAAMVGGLADWFAVTALFRHPLGLPLPHTAIVPHSQGRIADALGQFIVENFLDPELLDQRLKQRDPALVIGRWLAEPANAARLGWTIARSLPALVNTLDDEAVTNFLTDQARAHVASLRTGPGAGALVRHITDEDRHQPLIDAFLHASRKALRENDALVDELMQTMPWIARAAGRRAIVSRIERVLIDAERQRGHPLRRASTAALRQVAQMLDASPRMQGQVDGIKDAVLSHPAARGYLQQLWQTLKERLRGRGEADAGVQQAVADAAAQLGLGLENEPEVRQSLNRHLSALIVDLARLHGPDVGRVVSDTVRGWDAAELIDKLEQHVGNDLQYIRINGTLIGGLVGLALHAASMVLFTH